MFLVLGFSFAFCTLSFTLGVVGCGQQAAQETAPAPTVTAVTISGKLYSGTIKTSSVQTTVTGIRIMGSAVDPIANYNIVAIGTQSKKVYFPTSKTATADGAFSISVPSGESFYLEIIDEKKKFVAPVSFGASGESVFMAITPEAAGGAIELGKVVYESSKGAAVPTLEVSAAKLDENSTAKKKSSEGFVPVGAGNLGRGTKEAYYSGSLKDKIDEDDDGLPDVVDIDDDGDGKVDGLDDAPRKSGMTEVGISGISNTNVFSNLLLSYVNYPTYLNGILNTRPIDIATKTGLTISVSMAPGTNTSTFSDIRVVEGPAWIDTSIISTAEPTQYSGYPSGGTPWKNESYKLYQGSERWEVWIVPNATPEAGDVLKFKITTSSTTEYLISTLTYVFNDIPRLVAYSYFDGSNLVTKEGANLDLSIYQTGESGTSNVFGYKGSTITLLWTPPRDDLENQLTGMNYNLGAINYFNDIGATVKTESKRLSSSDLTTITDPSGLTYKYTFTPTTTESFLYFKVDLDAESPAANGGHASQLIQFFKKN